ncbi:NlpC/P60 family protein [Breznakia blatticola]|uniref:NlpC/P60 family protein n=1 Tax=Breznakia blatticola TaxID=1754012 RepID=A0A4R7ZFE2_9FIRM|nr:NlpC/P60 family protein [Breznakia blatticola]TDW08865.1 NlpC/P60 family protein [Breznakia blatticola]
MKKTTIVMGSILVGLVCTIFYVNLKDREDICEIEYGSFFDAKEHLDIPNDANVLSIDVDTKLPGTYVVKWEEADTKYEKSVIVSDTTNPKIELLQEATTTKKIHLNQDFMVEGNLHTISDEIDGTMHKVMIVDQETFERTRSEMAKKYLQEHKNVYVSNQDVQAYKSQRDTYGYAMLYSNVDTSRLGTYEVNVMAIDHSYLTTVVSYNIEVVGEDELIQEQELAAGATGSKMGDLAMQLATEKQGLASIAPDDGYYEVDKRLGNEFIEAPITTTKNAVANAALAKQGEQLTSEQLVTYALVDAGIITGNHQLLDVIDARHFPELATSLSESQIKPGDLVYYDDAGFGSAHVAIYVGANQAVHGGFEGNSVQISHVQLAYASTPRFYRFQTRMTWDEIYERVTNNQ